MSGNSQPKVDTNHFRAYDEASKYILRELSLVNNRLTWILTIHGFLYATYGFTLQKQLEIIEKITEALAGHASDIPTPKLQMNSACLSLQQIKYFLEAIASVGIFISIAGLLSIFAACLAMRSVSRAFEKNAEFFLVIRNEKPLHYSYKEDNIKLPHLLGGGILPIDLLGNASSLVIPGILFCSWFAAIAGIYWYGTPSIQGICPA